MILRLSQLTCGVALLAFTPFVLAQATATATENGIVSAAGSPGATQSVTYSIQGVGIAATVTTSASKTTATSVTSTSGADSTIVGGTEKSLTNDNEHALSTPAILGIVLAVVLAIVAIIIIIIVVHRRRTRDVKSRAKRKTIMDAEFAAASRTDLSQVTTRNDSMEKNPSLGYFDLAKPLPAVTEQKRIEVVAHKQVEEDRLSRSSTIIADAAEIAQINRKASGHQRRAKKSRDGQRHGNAALQILITNEHNRTSVLSQSLLISNPSTPVNKEPISPWKAQCDDGNGDAFAKRPSKL